MDISPWAYYKATGEVPTIFRLLLANCPFGGNDPANGGHGNCGWCLKHQKPRMHCKCINTATSDPRGNDSNIIEDWQKYIESLIIPQLQRFERELKEQQSETSNIPTSHEHGRVNERSIL